MGKFGDPLLANELSDPEISKRLKDRIDEDTHRTQSNTEKIVLQRGPKQGARSSSKNSEELNEK